MFQIFEFFLALFFFFFYMPSFPTRFQSLRAIVKGLQFASASFVGLFFCPKNTVSVSFFAWVSLCTLRLYLHRQVVWACWGLSVVWNGLCSGSDIHPLHVSGVFYIGLALIWTPRLNAQFFLECTGFFPGTHLLV